MKNSDLEFLQLELSRVSDWIKFADTKAGFVAVFYSAVFGFLWSQREAFFIRTLCIRDCSAPYVILFIVILALLVLGIYFLLTTVKPRIDNKNTDESLFFYGTVSQMKIEDYLKDVEEISDEKASRQIKEQIYTNSIIANTKMTNVRRSIDTLVVIGVLLLILFFL